MKQPKHITTAEQRERTVLWMARFEAEAEALMKAPPDGTHPDFVRIMIDAHLSQAADLAEQIREYDEEEVK